MWTLRRNLSPVLRRWWKRRRLRWWWSDRWGRRCSGGLGAAPCWRSSSPSTWWRWRGRRSSPLTGCYWQTPSNLRCSSVFSRDNYPSFSTLVRRNTMGTLPVRKKKAHYSDSGNWQIVLFVQCPSVYPLFSNFLHVRSQPLFSLAQWKSLIETTTSKTEQSIKHEVCRRRHDRRSRKYFPGVVIFSKNSVEIYVLPE